MVEPGPLGQVCRGETVAGASDTVPHVTWTWTRIQQVSDAGSIERGRDYATAPTVGVRRVSSDGVFADVSGTEEYAVWLGATQWSCTCPVGVSGAFCKHCVAVAIVAGEADPDADRPAATPSVPPRPSPARVGVGVGVEEAKSAVDSLRTRRFLDYGHTMDYARSSSDAVDVLEAHVRGGGENSVRLVERAFATLCTVMGRSDDSSGRVGDLGRGVLELHLVACQSQPPQPARLAAWLLREQFDSDGWFFPDVVDYASCLGTKGVDKYRKAVAARDPRAQPHGGSDCELERARQRLAVLDRDVDRVVATHGGALSAGHHYATVVKALDEIGRPDLALDWALRGLDLVGDDPRRSLITYATRRLSADGDYESALVLRRKALALKPILSRWFELRTQAVEAAVWDRERDAATAVLAAANPVGLVSAHLAEGDLDAAWAAYDRLPHAPHHTLVDALVKATSVSHPERAYEVYPVLVEAAISQKNRHGYREACRLLKARGVLAHQLGWDEAHQAEIGALAVVHRAKRSLLEELGRARLL